MTINEAIEILGESAYSGSTTLDDNFRQALKLGIEAMKRINNARAIGYSVPASLLPGETGE